MTHFVMPTLGASMSAGTLVAWHRQPGEHIARGEIIADVETEKGIIEVETFVGGVIERLLVSPGTKVPVGTPLAVIDEQAHAPSNESVSEPIGKAGPPRPILSTPSARQLARENGVDLASVEGTGKHGSVTRTDVERALEAPPPEAPPPEAPAMQTSPRRRISPYARRRGRELGIDPSVLASEARGHVVHADDVQKEAERKQQPAVKDKEAAMRHAIASAMALAKRDIPHYYLSTTIDIEPAMTWLASENDKRSVDERVVPGVLLLKAAALAMREVPELNAHWVGNRALLLERVHVGVAISLRQGGLVAPAIHDTDRLSVGALMVALKDLVGRARAGSFRSSELIDASVTVTSLGERGVETVYPIIYPPQVAMVGFGKIVERPWCVEGAVVPRRVVTATLAADHRASDGHRGGLYLSAIDRFLQSPEAL